MSILGKSVNFFIAYLAQPLTKGGSETTVYLSSILTQTGETITTADFAALGLGELTIDPLTSTSIESCTFTGVDAGAVSLTGVTRGLSAFGNDVATARKVYHPVGTLVIISFGVQSLNQLVDIVSNQTIAGNKTTSGLWAFSTSPTVPTPTTATQAVPKAYVDIRKVGAIVSASSLAPNIDSYNMYQITALAATMTFGNPTGTPTAGQSLIIRIKDSGSAQALYYGTQYREIGQALPSTTVGGKTLYLGFIYNATDTKWDLVGTAQQS